MHGGMQGTGTRLTARFVFQVATTSFIAASLQQNHSYCNVTETDDGGGGGVSLPYSPVFLGENYPEREGRKGKSFETSLSCLPFLLLLAQKFRQCVKGDTCDIGGEGEGSFDISQLI